MLLRLVMQVAMRQVFDVYPNVRIKVCEDDKMFNGQAERTEGEGLQATIGRRIRTDSIVVRKQMDDGKHERIFFENGDHVWRAVQKNDVTYTDWNKTLKFRRGRHKHGALIKRWVR